MKAKSLKKSTSQSLKSRWKKADSNLSFKQWVRSHLKSHDEAFAIQCNDWVFNKKVNVSAPPKGIGRTNGKKGSKSSEPKKGGKKEKD